MLNRAPPPANEYNLLPIQQTSEHSGTPIAAVSTGFLFNLYLFNIIYFYSSKSNRRHSLPLTPTLTHSRSRALSVEILLKSERFISCPEEWSIYNNY